MDINYSCFNRLLLFCLYASLILFCWSCLNLVVPVQVLHMASISEAPEWKCVVKLIIDRASDSSKIHFESQSDQIVIPNMFGTT